MGQYTTAVQNLYIAYFNRPADVGGLNFWESVLAMQGGNIKAISDAFSASPEYQAAYANMNSEAIINQIYVNLFGREAESGGRKFWADALSSGLLSISTIVADVARGAQGSDLTAFNAKAAAATIFTNTLYSTGSSMSYNGENALALARSYISNVVDEASLTQVVANANTVVMAMQALDISPAGKIQYLSNFNDHLTGSNGSDLFLATVSAMDNGFEASDQIDGGAGKDSLSIVVSGVPSYSAPAKVGLTNVENVSLVADGSIKVDANSWNGVGSVRAVANGHATMAAGNNTNLSLVDFLTNNSVNVNGGKDVNLVLSGVTNGGAINVGQTGAATGAVNIAAAIAGGSFSDNFVASPISVYGGTSVNVLQTRPYLTEGYYSENAAVNVVGTVATTSVVSKADVLVDYNANVVNISDANFLSDTKLGSIKSITVDGASDVTIKDNALSSLKLANFTIPNSHVDIDNGFLLASSTTSLALSLQRVRTALSDKGVYSHFDIKLVGGSSSTLNSLDAPALRSINVTGEGLLNLPLEVHNLSTVTVSEKASLIFASIFSQVSKIDTSATTGTANVLIRGGQTSYSGGAGVDEVTLVDRAISMPISLGAGNDKFAFASNSDLPSALVTGGSGTDTVKLSITDAAAFAANTSFASIVSEFEILEVSGCQGVQSVDLAALGKFGNLDVTASGFVKTLTINNLPTGGSLSLHGDIVGTYTLQNAAYAASKTDELKLAMHGNSVRFNPDAIANVLATVNANEIEAVRITLDNAWDDPVTHSLSLNGNAISSINISGTAGLTLIANSANVSSLDAHAISVNGFSWTSGALTGAAVVKGSSTVANTIDLSAAKAAVSYFGSSANDNVTVGAASTSLMLYGGSDSITFSVANASVERFSTILDPRAGLSLQLLDKGTESFTSSKLSLASNASLQDYANAVVQAGGDASSNGRGAWFQFGGDTYYVQSQHNASLNPSFLGGTDFIVKLTGLVDLSNASVSTSNGANGLSLL